jgi:hypothetical protein
MYIRNVSRISSADSATTPVKGKGLPILSVGRSPLGAAVEPGVVDPSVVESTVVEPTVVEPSPESPAHAVINPIVRTSANNLRIDAMRPPLESG